MSSSELVIILIFRLPDSKEKLKKIKPIHNEITKIFSRLSRAGKFLLSANVFFCLR